MKESVKEYVEKLDAKGLEQLAETDPEYYEFFTNFAYGDVVSHGNLDERTRWIAILAELLGCQAYDAFEQMVHGALAYGLDPVAIKEIVYQGTAYLGFGRVYSFVNITNKVFAEKGIALPLAGQSTTTLDNRQEKGTDKQVEIFGEQMKDFYKGGHINYWLASNCFGDYYTRGGLTVNEREMITVCFLAAQGGCEPQLIGHCQANMRIGNSKEMLMEVISQCVPYIGYPRTLNAISCLEKASES